jgi:glycosyltransferase involved in cell wall biosynthesis
MGWRGACVYAARNVWNEFDRRWAPLPRAAFRQAAALIAATRGIQSEIRRFYHRESEVISEIGEPPVSFSDISRRHQGEPLRLLWSGLHLPGKALPVLLRALAQTGDGVDWRLTVLGAGPLTPAWKRECHRLGLAARCNWLGQVKREEAVLQMRSAHVLAVSSLHDLTSTVVVEALCSALPVICPDLYGFRDAVTEECGFRVPATSVGALQAGMARSIVALHDDESLRRRMAAAALDRSRSYAWSWKADLVNTIYHTALQGRSC